MVENGETPHRYVTFAETGASRGGIEITTISELIEGAPAGEFDDPQRLDFSILLYLTRGTLQQYVDFVPVDVRAGELLLIRPGQSLRWGRLEGLEGTCVFFRPDALDPYAAALLPPAHQPILQGLESLQARELFARFHLMGLRPPRDLPGSSWKHQGYAMLLRYQLSSLVIYLALSTTTETPVTSPRYLAFQTLLEESFRKHQDAAWYATELGISPRTLRGIVTQAVGHGTKRAIDERIVLEAKRFLTHSALPVAEIGTVLGFRDSSNFSSFFHRRAGMPPAAFRDAWGSSQA